MKYESKQQTIARSAEQIFAVVSKFSNFTPILKDKVEDWSADDDSCSFKAQGFSLALSITERKEFELIKIETTSSPMPFCFLLQLSSIAPYQTNIEVVMDVELNGMLKMMVGNKLQQVVDTIAEQIAGGFNGVIPTAQ